MFLNEIYDLRVQQQGHGADSVEGRGLAHGLAYRKLQINATKRCDPGAYRIDEIPRGLFLFDSLSQD